MNKEQFNCENMPNAGKLMSSLRYSGYENKVALSDIIDNSLDAEASSIEIQISGEIKTGKASISIIDNGIGMGDAVLAQALRLGSLPERDIDSDLGRFGMGLVTASISIARRIEVYTKMEGSPLFVGVMDLDVMEDTNSFNIYRGLATPDQEKLAESHGLKTQGTVILLTKCDKLARVSIEEFENALRNKLGETYRYFLRSGTRITVNEKAVSIIDPMWQDGQDVEKYKLQSEVYTDKFEVKLEDGSTETATVKVYRLPDELPAKEMKKLGINRDTQGFYVLRNYRQVAMGDDFGGVWKRHNSLNRVRVEVLVSGRLDSQMGVNYTKHTVSPSEAIRNILKNDIMPHVDRFRTFYPSNKKSSQVSSEIDFSDAEIQIKQKAKLLEKATGKVYETSDVTKISESKTVDVAAHTRGLPSAGDVVQFENDNLGESGPIFKVEKRNKLTVITWNNSHPFFQKFLFAQRDEPELVNAVSFLAYALGEAKIKYSTPETEKLLNSVIDTMSKNLRILLD